MKIFATIFALYIFSLSVNAYDEIECLCEKYEVAADIDENSQSGDDGCCAEGCSPFSICHTCPGFTISPIFYIARPVFNKKPSASIFHLQQFISTFYGNIWQPPKIG